MTLREKCEAAANDVMAADCAHSPGVADGPCYLCVAAEIERVAREFAAEALRQLVKTKNGSWWMDEGFVWRVVSAVEPEGPSSPAFLLPEDAERAREQIVSAAIEAAAKGEK